ncbi:hypothetical protein [Halorussus salinus]|uniref:hypothetical protein n=1 Tax=Halorussus salinus TaxID=1364935 RepID=UPI001091EB1A|nr:hypothetical protein [Halorussus salinus]
MTDPVFDRFRLTVEFDDDFERQVTGEGRAYNPRVSLGIQAGDVSISGAEKGYTGVYLTNFLGQALEAVETIENGEKRVIKTADGPTYLVLDPRDDETMTFAQCFSKKSADEPHERMSIEPQVIITKEAFTKEVIRLGNESLEKIFATNEDVRDHRQIRELQELLETVEDRR